MSSTTTTGELGRSSTAPAHGKDTSADLDRQAQAARLARLEPGQFQPARKPEGLALSTRPSLSYWKDAWRRLLKNTQAVVSLVIIVLLVLFTLFGPMVWRVDPSEQLLGRVSESPSLGSQVKVMGEQAEWVDPEVTVPAVTGDVQASTLPAPGKLATSGDPSPSSVRLTWEPVPGADEGYVIYRSDHAPSGAGDLGVPVGQTDAAGKVGYHDQFDLRPGNHWYSVVAKRGGEESPNAATLSVRLDPSLPLAEAQALDPAAQPGQTVKLPARPLGTDYLGRDLLARLMAGARVSLFIGFVAPFLSVIIGVLVGGIAGYFGGRVDQVLMRGTDFVLALPFLLFMILFRVASGVQPGEGGVGPMMVALVVLSWTGPARLTRGQVLQLRESEFVQAARLLGAKPMYLILRHLIPNTLGVILVSLTFAIPSAIFTEAFLSFIGMGVVPPTPSWGSMCDDGVKSFLNHPHEFVFPAALISVTVLAFNLLGDGLRDALDPKMRGKS